MLGPQLLHPLLRPYVATLTAYDVSGAAGIHRGLPGTTVTFVLPLDEPIRVGWARDPGEPRTAWSSIAGLHAAPAAIHHGGRQTGFFLGLTLAGARALLGLPARAIGGRLSDLDEVAPHLADLPELLHDTDDWARRSRLLQDALVRALSRTDGPAVRARAGQAEVGRALACLTRGVAVADVADEVGYSRRHLRNLVQAETGLSPQQFRRVARFEASRDLVVEAARRGTPLADAATAGGYADHAHLDRDWRDLAGCPPTTWLAEEFPIVQDHAAPSA